MLFQARLGFALILVISDANLALAQNSRWSAPAFQMVAKKLFVHSKFVARLIVYSRWGK